MGVAEGQASSTGPLQQQPLTQFGGDVAAPEGNGLAVHVDEPVDIDVDGDEHTDSTEGDGHDGIRSGRSNAVAGAQSAGITEVLKCLICKDAPVNAGIRHGYRYVHAVLPGVSLHC